MNQFPDTINIKIVDDKTNLPVSNIMIAIHLFARQKNDYHFLTVHSDQHGIIEISKEWVIAQIDEDMDYFIMDYSSGIDDLYPKIEIEVMNDDHIKGAIEANMYYNENGERNGLIQSLTNSENEVNVQISITKKIG
jgi:hypothetical protein